jgi:signal transduction histidine kinase/CheY-like chemotaxis protein
MCVNHEPNGEFADVADRGGFTRSAGRWIRGVVTTLLLAAAPALVLAQQSFVVSPLTQVSSPTRYQDLSEYAEWCEVFADETPAAILAHGCGWRALAENGGFVGSVQDSTRWVRLAVRNATSGELVRDLLLLPSGLDSVSFFVWQGDGWRQVDSGLNTPMDVRDPALRGQNAVRLRLRADSIATVYVQVKAGGMLRVQPQLWEPLDRELALERASLLFATLNGGMMVAILFAALMFFVSRQREYLYFSLAVSGELLADLLRSSLLQRFVWPSSLSVPANLSVIAAGMAVIGGVSFVYAVLPGVRRQGWWHRLVVVSVVAVALGQVLALVVDFGTGSLLLWHLAVLILLSALAVQSAAEWRSGDFVGAWLVGAAAVLLIGIISRFLVYHGALTVAVWESLIYPVAVTLVVLLLLLALVERTGGITRKLATAETKNAAQLDFLVKMSHELRAPLDTILGNAQLLLRRESQKKQDGLHAVLQSGRHLLRMIDDILDYARGVSGAIDVCPEPLELKGFLQFIAVGGKLFAVRNRNQFVLRCHGAAIGDGPLWIKADPGRLRAVLDNLLINASRHTEEGWIFLDCSVAPSADHGYRIDFSVTDTGEGIAPEDLQRIFEPFERAGRQRALGASEGRVGKGAGIGLAISRQLVELMGGQLQVDSTLGRGARFRFSVTLPAVDVPAAVVDSHPMDMPSLVAYAGPRRRIMLVDDDADSLLILRTLLEFVGFEVVTAGSGNEAAGNLESGLKIDLIVVDQMMDDGDGWHLLERAARAAPDVPRILISAALPASNAGGDTGALRYSAFLSKPLDHERLLRCIGEVLSLQWSAQAQSGDALHAPAGPSISPEDRQALARCVTLGAVTHIRRWARELRQRKPECAEFASAVDQAVEDLDFPRLRRLAGLSPEDTNAQ